MTTPDYKAIWNSWRGGKSWQEMWTNFRKPPESKAVQMPELPESELQAAETKAAVPVNVVELQASVVNLKKENGDLKAALAQKQTLYDGKA